MKRSGTTPRPTAAGVHDHDQLASRGPRSGSTARTPTSTRRSSTTSCPAANTSSLFKRPDLNDRPRREHQRQAGPDVQAALHAADRGVGCRPPPAGARSASRTAPVRPRCRHRPRRRGPRRWRPPGASTTARAGERPGAHRRARLPLARDLRTALARLIPADAAVLEVGLRGGGAARVAAEPRVARGSTTCPSWSSGGGRATRRSRSRSGTSRAPAPARTTRLEPRGPESWDAIVCDRLCHSVLDVQALLLGMKRRLAPDGRIYLTAFNYLWEVPVRLAELAG